MCFLQKKWPYCFASSSLHLFITILIEFKPVAAKLHFIFFLSFISYRQLILYASHSELLRRRAKKSTVLLCEQRWRRWKRGESYDITSFHIEVVRGVSINCFVLSNPNLTSLGYSKRVPRPTYFNTIATLRIDSSFLTYNNQLSEDITLYNRLSSHLFLNIHLLLP